jgi:hypothetical protein
MQLLTRELAQIKEPSSPGFERCDAGKHYAATFAYGSKRW